MEDGGAQLIALVALTGLVCASVTHRTRRRARGPVRFRRIERAERRGRDRFLESAVEALAEARADLPVPAERSTPDATAAGTASPAAGGAPGARSLDLRVEDVDLRSDVAGADRRPDFQPDLDPDPDGVRPEAAT